MKKHAYLIVAHNNFRILEQLLTLIDDSRNDIYLHIGSDISVDLDMFVDKCINANLYLSEKRVNIRWGHSSQVEATLSLLKQAKTNNTYEYYHLISGVDLPLKSQEYIHNFFDKNSGLEYISCEYSERWLPRFKYYYFLREIQRKKGSIIGKILSGGDSILVLLQKILRINRLNSYSLTIYKGSNWFSITDNFASYLLSREEEINRLVRFSLCADESFIQTIIMDSPFKNSLAGTNMRLVDWIRGEPYTFKSDDLAELINSDMLFARKFDEKTDFNIVQELSNHLLQCVE